MISDSLINTDKLKFKNLRPLSFLIHLLSVKHLSIKQDLRQTSNISKLHNQYIRKAIKLPVLFDPIIQFGIKSLFFLFFTFTLPPPQPLSPSKNIVSCSADNL